MTVEIAHREEENPTRNVISPVPLGTGRLSIDSKLQIYKQIFETNKALRNTAMRMCKKKQTSKHCKIKSSGIWLCPVVCKK